MLNIIFVELWWSKTNDKHTTKCYMFLYLMPSKVQPEKELEFKLGLIFFDIIFLFFFSRLRKACSLQMYWISAVAEDGHPWGLRWRNKRPARSRCACYACVETGCARCHFRRGRYKRSRILTSAIIESLNYRMKFANWHSKLIVSFHM